MSDDDILIYVDNTPGRGSDTSRDAGRTPDRPLATVDEAFRRLPPHWHGSAEIRLAVTGLDYVSKATEVSFGSPIGPSGSPLVIRGGYAPDPDFPIIEATGGSGNDVTTDMDIPLDRLIGRVLTRESEGDAPGGTAISIRGNSAGPSTIFLQRSIGSIGLRERFAVMQPGVNIQTGTPDLPDQPGNTLNLTSHDGRSPNLTLIGIRIAPHMGGGLNLLSVRAVCDTCEFFFKRHPDVREPINCFVHTNSRIQGGGEAKRLQAGVFIHSDNASNVIWATRGGVLGGHLTFRDITVRSSQGGAFVPKSLEALRSPIQIMAGGSALAEVSKERGTIFSGWGTESNKARIRDVTGTDGDGLRVFNGGSMNSPLGPVHLNIFGCQRDGIRLDSGSTASFGTPGRLDRMTGRVIGAETGLITRGNFNLGFGMNVRNSSHAVVSTDTTLYGVRGDVALDDVVLVDSVRGRGWTAVSSAPQSNTRLSSVCLPTPA